MFDRRLLGALSGFLRFSAGAFHLLPADGQHDVSGYPVAGTDDTEVCFGGGTKIAPGISHADDPGEDPIAGLEAGFEFELGVDCGGGVVVGVGAGIA
eukprot:CAMPEP_0202453882 /NCGR_PEP_ID=MMETSP1360-20130828/11754_1 /ASSEMBLY_ACC=CAM_ASM_000848 /TAXON_ID=515479 /ORGANISM="Licmophora paradoxa, Strain CCMP2313" /LENGTH=96 /DNA_ID=CAMNT_0049073077 /DNA_START=91 /DNA_END=378 /DNA_ORIENTATION=+